VTLRNLYIYYSKILKQLTCNHRNLTPSLPFNF